MIFNKFKYTALILMMTFFTTIAEGNYDKIAYDFNFTDINENKNTPICFPKNKPHKIPNGTGESRELIVVPFRTTPAFAKANNGIIPKAT